MKNKKITIIEAFDNKLQVKEYIRENYIAKDIIKEKLLKPIQEEGQKTYDKFMDNDNKDFEIDGAILQELGHIEGMIIELLEDK